MTRVPLRGNAVGILLPLILSVLTAGFAASACAQDDPAGEVAEKSDVRYSVATSSRLGQLTYVPEQWGELQLRLENTGSSVRDLVCSSYFNDDQSLQFGRRVWLPANARLTLTHPVLIPPADKFNNNGGRIESLVIDKSSGSELLLKDDTGQLRHEQPVSVVPDQRHTGVVAGWRPNEIVPQDVLDLVTASRVAQGLNNRVTFLTGHFLPADATSLDYLDHLVISENRLLDDEAALAAVRRWLHAGGRLWFMLDRADPLILEQLLGDDFDGEVIERVSLTSARIDTAPSLSAPNGEIGEPHEYEEPVAMARVAVSGMQVWNTVEGWPAAMSCSCGEGRVLITTLGPRAWFGPAPPPPPKTPPLQSPYVPLPPMVDLAAFVLAKREASPLPASTLQPIAQEYVSYSVPKWSLVMGTMGVFLALMFAAGIYLWRRDRLEHFGWSGSLLAVLFGIALTGIGMANHFGVPDAIASVQIAQAISGTDDVRAYGAIGVFRPEGSGAPIQTSQSGRLWPDLSTVSGETCRLVMSDLGKSTWEGLTQPAGLRMYSDVTSRSLADRITGQSTVDAKGVTGRFTANAASEGDAILATRFGRIGVKLSPDGQFTAAANDVFEKDVYLSSTFLGDVQDRRRRMLEQLFSDRSWVNSLDRPHLLLWVQGWEHGFEFGEGLQPAGETLLTVPLETTRPAPGSEFVIPSPLLSFETARPPDGSLPAGFWDDVRHEWQERSSPSTTWLNFQVPSGLLPLEATRARLQVKVSGPMGKLEIMGVKNGTVESLGTVDNPLGTIEIDLNDPAVLALSDDGKLSLGVSAGTSSAAGLSGGGAANYWRIESLNLQLWGIAAESSEVE